MAPADSISIVVDNGTYGTIRMHQERDYPGRVSGSDLFNPDFAALAARLRLAVGVHRRKRRCSSRRFADALASGRPTLLHVKLDSDVSTTRTTLSALRAKSMAR
jgi:acetolactate synthase I/II/III large subunit